MAKRWRENIKKKKKAGEGNRPGRSETAATLFSSCQFRKKQTNKQTKAQRLPLLPPPPPRLLSSVFSLCCSFFSWPTSSSAPLDDAGLFLSSRLQDSESFARLRQTSCVTHHPTALKKKKRQRCSTLRRCLRLESDVTMAANKCTVGIRASADYIITRTRYTSSLSPGSPPSWNPAESLPAFPESSVSQLIRRDPKSAKQRA